jgi:UDP-N-acetylglucosamine:LPS N-acetylglucosamine transferase
MRIGIACSGGGHLKEAQKALKLIESDNYIFWATIYSDHLKSFSHDNNVYYLSDFKQNIFLLFKNLLNSLKIIIVEKPDVIISTGASVAIPLCLISKFIFRKKLLYIESGGQVYTPSKTGRLIYHVADMFIVQWKPMLKNFPKAEYGGNLF